MKIGVIRLSSLGDIVYLTPFLENLRRIYINDEITLFTEESYKDLFKNDKRIDYVLSEPVNDKLDIIYDMHRTRKSKKFLSKLNFNEYKTLNKRDFERRFMIITKIRMKIPDVKDRYLEVLKDFNLKKVNPFFSLGNYEHKIAREDLKIYKRPRIALFPGAKRKSRQWKYYNELSRLFGGKIFLFGSKDEERFSNILHLKGFFGLPLNLLKAYLSLMDIVIGNDSGIVHLAQAVGVKAIMIYGSSIPEFGFKPFYGDYISRNLPCKPCSLHGTDFCIFKFKCLEIIKPEEVYRKIKERLKVYD